MRITRLTLRNWRTFKNLDVPVGQRLVIVGPNASGKSNLLDAVRFLRDLSAPGGGLQHAVSSRGGLSRVRCLFSGANNHGWVTVAVDVLDDATSEQWRYEIDVRSEGSGRHRVFVAREVVSRDGVVLVNRPDADDDADPERLTQTVLEQISANKEFRDVAEFFAEVRYLHLVPQVIRDASRAGGQVDDPFGGDFIARITTMPARTRDAWLRRVTEALRSAVPQFESLNVVVDQAGRPHLESRYTNWRREGARQDERDMSDGTLRLIGILWALVEGGRRGAPVLLEEPELSLHSAVVRLLPTVLARAQRTGGAQLFLTTHSAQLLEDEGIGADEVLVLTPSSDGTLGRVLADDPDAMGMLESGLSVAEVAVPRSAPENVDDLVRVVLGGQ